jgi:hypothetical protein
MHVFQENMNKMFMLHGERVLQNMKSGVRNIRIYVQSEVCKLTLKDVRSAVCGTSSIC